MKVNDIVNVYWESIDASINNSLERLRKKFAEDKALIERAYWSRLQWIAAEWANQRGLVAWQIQRGWWTAIEQAQFENRLKSWTAKEVWAAEDDRFSRLSALNKDLQANETGYDEYLMNNRKEERDRLIEQARLDSEASKNWTSSAWSSNTWTAWRSSYIPRSSSKWWSWAWLWTWGWTTWWSWPKDVTWKTGIDINNIEANNNASWAMISWAWKIAWKLAGYGKNIPYLWWTLKAWSKYLWPVWNLISAWGSIAEIYKDATNPNLTVAQKLKLAWLEAGVFAAPLVWWAIWWTAGAATIVWAVPWYIWGTAAWVVWANKINNYQSKLRNTYLNLKK